MIPVHCPICCDEPFQDQQSLFFHLRGIRNNLFCPICSERFATFELLVKHLSRTCYGPKSLNKERRGSVTNSSPSSVVSFSSTENIAGGHIENGTVDEVKEETPKPDVSQVSPVFPVALQKKLSKHISISIGPSDNKGVQKTDVSGVSTNLKRKHTESNVSPGVSESVKVSSEKCSKEIINLPSKSPSSLVSSVKKSKMSVKNSPETVSKSIKPGPMSYKLAALSKDNLNKTSNDAKSTDSNSKPTTSKVNPFTAGRKHRPEKSILYESNKVEATLNIQNGTSSLASNSFIQDVASKKKVQSSKERYNNGAEVLCSKNDPLQIPQVEPPKRGRGRPRKVTNTPFDILVNTQNDNVQFVLPEIIDETELQVTSSSNDLSCNASANLQPGECSRTANRVNEVNSLTHGESHEATQEATQEIENSVDSKTEPDDDYNCSACNMRFTSIYEHIKKYHNGEEVVVELPATEITEDLKAFQAGSDNKIAIETNSYEEENGNDDAKPDVKQQDSDFPEQSISDMEDDSDLKPDVKSNKDVIVPDLPSGKDTVVPDLNSELPSPSFNPFKISVSTTKKPIPGKWVRSSTNKKDYYQYAHDHVKLKKLVEELKNNPAIHPKIKIPIKHMYENPKINVIEITNKPNSPCFTFKVVDFKKPIPMYVVERELDNTNDASLLLGDKASYVIANAMETEKIPIPDESEVIAVMKVILGSDKSLTIENIVFKEKPKNENMVPILKEVSDPKIPLLNNAKLLIWQCTKCLATTWKFPLNKDSHSCNACPVCHKPFVTAVSLRKHMVHHTKDDSRYCEECHQSFADKGLLEKHKDQHKNLYFCSLCKLFLSKDKEQDHRNLHKKSSSEQFSCSVCHKIFGSSSEIKNHENRTCSKLVAKYNCSLCDKKFFSLTAHTYHTMEHTAISIKFPCRFCPKMFTKEKEQNLGKAGKRKPSRYMQKIWHERIHTRERPHLCSACPKRFRSYPYLKAHEQKVHQLSTHVDFFMYMCKICDKIFKNEDLLLKHSKEHDTTTEVPT